MIRTLVMPALVSISMIAAVTAAQAETVFDFIPRMEFVELPELVTKDQSNRVYVCGTASGERETCSVTIKSIVVESPKEPKK